MKKFWNELEDNICGILLLVMMLLTCVNVFARYVLLSSMPFVEELTNAGLILLSIAGAAVAAKRGAHLGLTVLTERFSPAGQKACALLVAGRCLWCHDSGRRCVPGDSLLPAVYPYAEKRCNELGR